RDAERDEQLQRTVSVAEPEQRRKVQKASRAGEVTADGRELHADRDDPALAYQRGDLPEHRSERDDVDDADQSRERAPHELWRNGAIQSPNHSQRIRGTPEERRAATPAARYSRSARFVSGGALSDVRPAAAVHGVEAV